MTVYDNIPLRLTHEDQWVCWRNECRECETVQDPEHKTCIECGEKTTKRPIDASNGQFARSNDPETWTSLDDAREFHENNDTHGVGFMFSPDDDFVGIDLDDCRDPDTGEIEDWASNIITKLASYVEVSPSGTGLHIIIFGELPEGGNRHDNVEMYEEGRYFTVSGDLPHGIRYGVEWRQDELEAVHSTHVDVGDSAASETVDFLLDPPADLEDETFENDLGRTLSEIRNSDKKLDRLLEEIEAGYESPSEADMAAVSKLWWWRFGRQDIANIIRKHRARSKVIDRGDYLELTISKAATGEQYDPRPNNDFDIDIIEDRDLYDTIGEATFPDTHFVLRKPPRAGGSHWTIDRLSEDEIVVLASRHAICEHHLGILDDVMPEGKSAVHRVGSHRACDNPDKEKCPKESETREDRNDIEDKVIDTLYKNRLVTAEDCPSRFCANEFIRLAEKHAHAVVTVPQLLGNLERDLSENNLLIDEEQALAFFRTDSVELVEIAKKYEPDGTPQVQTLSAPITRQMGALDDIREQIRADQEEREEQAEENDHDWRRTPDEIEIIDAIEYLESVKSTLGVSEMVDEMEDDVGMKDVMDVMRDRLADIERPEPRTDPADFREKLAEYTAKFYHDGSVDPDAYIEAALHPYEDKPFDFKSAGGGYRLRMIGGRTIFGDDDLRKFEQIGVIAGPEGELLFQDLGIDATVVEIDEFRYADDFVVIPVAKYDDDESPERQTKQRKRAAKVSQELNARSHPHMAVAGTKQGAEDHHSELDAGMADVIGNPDSPAKDIRTGWSAGQSTIIYANSAVSRGVDAPAFDISVVASSEFATPYWEARRSYYTDEKKDDDEERRAAAIEAELKAHELTNAVLRPSPTPNVEEYYGTKYIVASEWDSKRLKYLQDSAIPRFSYAENVANFLEQVTIGGGLRQTMDDIYDRLDGDERAFIEVASKTEFTETIHDRPSLSHDSLATWRENRYLTREGVCDDVLTTLITWGEATTGEIQDAFPELPGGAVSSALYVLEQKGLVTSQKEKTDTRGRPSTVWTVEN